MQTGPTPVEAPSISEVVNWCVDFLVGLVQLLAATTGGALLLGLIALFAVARLRGRRRY